MNEKGLNRRFWEPFSEVLLKIRYEPYPREDDSSTSDCEELIDVFGPIPDIRNQLTAVGELANI